MSNKATITFSQAHVQPPVYVVTSLSEPPWETLEMEVDKEHQASGNLVFTRHFENAPQGDHQYKIRIGDGYWVVDESKDSATDEHGNRNNVIHVEQVATESQQGKEDGLQDNRNDSSMDSDGNIPLPSIPIPFVVVEKVADQEQPEYGDTEPHPLAPNVAKRMADFQPDFETTYEEEAAADSELPKSPEVPLLVVEKTDDRLEHGDDFGQDATAGQKIAHDKRAADTAPDKLVVMPEGHVEPGTADEQAAPLFRHETAQLKESTSTPSLDTIDEVSIQSSADQTSSEDNINTPGESQDEEASSPEPLMSHEFDSVQPHTELGSGPLLSHEAAPQDEESDELENAPFLPHETVANGDSEYSDEDDIDELDAAPLLSHETGFSSYKGSEITTNSDFLDVDVSEPRHYTYDDDDEGYAGNVVEPDEAATFTHGDVNDDNGFGEDGAPLLPHERDSEIHDDSSPEEDGGFTLHSQPTFGYETDNAKDLFGGGGRPNIFRARTNSSTLPHKLPLSDAEDENLHDPSLERFPTNREQILQRVATIGLQLPEDQTMEEHVHSPVMSVLSQACSSVDLVPVKSYTSLASVPEADDSDDAEEDDADVESLPSPMVMKLGRVTNDFARDSCATPLPDDSKRLELNENDSAHGQATRAAQYSEADSVGRNDGAKDVTLSRLRESIATPAKVFNTTTTLLTSEKQEPSTNNDSIALASGSELRQRNLPQQDTSKDLATPSSTFEDAPENSGAVQTPTPQQFSQHNESFLQSFFRVVFGPVGRFLTSCLSDRKRAG
ncbi:hypothetical protein CC86DRAFT_307416 [Ophiobolus disseminans]|uniref:Uncharacterized protein n=1 Tax=Ophiobolus disseminans TaxID=1469910 RepID=A0A6A6ZE93_9PLEO|nr:hypothetical protein CC86DRAFT_307416 [Ophiobolus disseminans]